MAKKQELEVKYRVRADKKKVTITICTEGTETLNELDVTLSLTTLLKALEERQNGKD